MLLTRLTRMQSASAISALSATARGGPGFRARSRPASAIIRHARASQQPGPVRDVRVRDCFAVGCFNDGSTCS
ncbi:hypothetical protein ADL15_41150 [Actinoplanes awajinensis subsp. mycoplanecinus]|uniref:Uncharacterized protein n=1 Tax=Actinoplanes awajinensis subsp. mycoplanecinus TaxID=135947 RepID=A0A101JEK6_9ACTN|nr:hypothetical protein ADL15_41150 [Actinoplanes awajinensis subsp. mycoplanecinus]